ncbi:MAG: T9SS type A sorting domain-containing protein [Bacteroidia bacterium]|nr:T9SS type A sorting domain-containing protein [Bacteroidia bacterium]
MKNYIYLLLLFALLTFKGNSQNSLCNGALPLGTDTTFIFPLSINTGTAEVGPNYGCLTSLPNPSWYYLLVEQPGDISIEIHTVPQQDVDFVLWGPFTSNTAPCLNQLTAIGTPVSHHSSGAGGGYPDGNMIDCSSDPSWQEYAYIPNSQTGQYYIILFTNPLNQAANIIFKQTNIGQGGAGTINNYNVYCNFDTITTIVGACNPLTNQYSVSGDMYFHFSPSNYLMTGEIILTDQPSGITYIFNWPFINSSSPVAFNLYGNFSDGASHTLTAIFTNAPNCMYTTTYIAPAACLTCTANAGPDISVCGLTTTLNATVNTGDVNTQWLPQSGITYTNIYSPTAVITASYPGIFNLIWQVTNSVGITCTDTVKVTFTQQPVANAGPDANVCQLNYTMAAIPSVMGAAVWTQLSGPVMGVLTNPTSPTSSFTVPQPGSYSFIWTETNGGCVDSDTVTINFQSVPTSTFAAESPICLGDSGVVVYTGTGGFMSTYSWNFGTATVLSGTGVGPFYVTWSAAGIYDISLVVQNNGCMSILTNHQVQVNSGTPGCCIIPTPNAGPDTAVCGLTYQLQGSLPAPGNVSSWSMVSGPGISNIIGYNVTVTSAGTYTFQLHEINGICDSSDFVTIIFNSVPMPDAGLDFFVCGKFAHISATTTTTGGQWSGPAGIAYYDAPIDSTSHYNPTYADSSSTWIRAIVYENDTVTMYWFENNGSCTNYDSVNVYFGSIMPANHLVNPADSVVCGPVFNLLNAQSSGYGYGYWLDTVMSTIFTPLPTNLNPVVTINSNNYGYHDFYWITVNGICRDTSTVVRVNFKTNKIEGIAQSSLVTDFSNFKAELFNDVSYENSPFSNCNLTSSGSFSLWAEPNQNYYLKLSKINPLLYPGIANSYYNNSYSWENATILTATGSCDTLAANLPLYTMTPATGGQCRIYGFVRYDGSLAPVANATVYIRYQPNQLPARFELTNQNGYYSINNIPNGNYKLYVDMPGLPQVTNHHIVINSNDTVFANVNFIVDTTSIYKDYGFGIYADTTGFIGVNEIFVENNDFICFPNPASDFIKIIFSNEINESSIITIYNIEGKAVIEKTILRSETKVDLGSLSSGIYTIEIKNDKFVKREKFVKL